MTTSPPSLPGDHQRNLDLVLKQLDAFVDRVEYGQEFYEAKVELADLPIRAEPWMGPYIAHYYRTVKKWDPSLTISIYDGRMGIRLSRASQYTMLVRAEEARRERAEERKANWAFGIFVLLLAMGLFLAVN